MPGGDPRLPGRARDGTLIAPPARAFPNEGLGRLSPCSDRRKDRAKIQAIDPAIDGVALCLAGGDLAGMVGRTSEGRVRSWVDWRRTTDGVGRDHVEWELRQFLTHEPLAFAASIPTEKVLFVGAAFDTVVPRRHQDLLWEALGRPTRLEVPFGHYSAALAIDTILGACASHFAARTVRRTAAPVR